MDNPVVFHEGCDGLAYACNLAHRHVSLAGRTQEGFGGIGPIIKSLFLFVFGLSTLVYAVSQTSI